MFEPLPSEYLGDGEVMQTGFPNQSKRNARFGKPGHEITDNETTELFLDNFKRHLIRSAPSILKGQ